MKAVELAKRKPNRLPEYDYSRAGYYFITVCTKDKRPVLWAPAIYGSTLQTGDVGADIIRPIQAPFLSEIGSMVEQAIREIPAHYSNVRLDKYVVMPNHIHLILALDQSVGRMISAPTKSLSTIVGSMKRYTSKMVGFPLWQKSFHDHVIRNETDYLRIWAYIGTNPLKWREDCYYV